jgi:hypothetical protein
VAGRLPYSKRPKRQKKIECKGEKFLIKKVLGGLKMVLSQGSETLFNQNKQNI